MDADGTLWKAKTKKPWKIKDASLDNSTIQLLQEIKRLKSRIIMISYQSHTQKKKAVKKLSLWLSSFKLNKYIDKVYVADKKRNPKHKIISKMLENLKIKNKDAIMIGDSYKWDYLAAKKAGIRGFLLKRPENNKYKVRKYTLGKMKDILK